MTSSDDGTLDELLYSSFHDNSEGGAESPSLVAAPLICGGCGERVSDRFVLLAAGQAWHGPCLRCSQCQCELQTHSSLYCRDGSIYCQLDYCRLFGVGRCARCSQPIPSSALVMRSGDLTFHLQCFSCQECDVTLLPGNLYCVEGRSLYCQSHYQTDESSLSLQLTNSQVQVSRDGEEPVSSPEPRLDERVPGGGAQRRVKRMRTCFRREQLRALEAYFAQKHNPDGKDWISLSNHTGLPKRVLQVWFQNARAKLRRSLSSDAPHTAISTFASEAETIETVAMAPCQDVLTQQTSTIDQLELSLLTAPICETSLNHNMDHTSPVETYNNSALLDYSTQNAHVLSSLGDIDLEPGIIMELHHEESVSMP
ncbi:LIM/homeobox protein Lhx9-like [Colossoma macropomum]|uniref:LIM/homeobox protein Lhx9-like n=1 Tax=Colossoma macropomum TaxID=42526 RepID=UPI001863B21B|nr:LIM/homeobox protein Lhx9-like [Colossoma macropomum]